MPNQIKQEPRFVIDLKKSQDCLAQQWQQKAHEWFLKKELNKLKRKLEEKEAKMEADQKKLKQFKALVATDVQFRRKT